MTKVDTVLLLFHQRLCLHTNTDLTTSSHYNSVSLLNNMGFEKQMKKILHATQLHKKHTHHWTFSKPLKHWKPRNYIFVKYENTSPFTLTNLYTLNHSRITGSLCNHDPIKQY